MNQTPVAVFAYNRPEHLDKTLEALSHCRRIEECDVFIHCDGVNNPDYKTSVEKTCMVAQKWAKKMNWKIIEEGKNIGCDASIIKYVTKFCKDFGRVIVVEDDIIVSPAFISFILEALDRYQDSPNVYQVAGFTFSGKRLTKKDAFLIPLTSSWGWATWQRAWEAFDINYDEARISLNDATFRTLFDLNDSYPPYHILLSDDIERKKETWDIWWYFRVFKKNGLVLYPTRSIVYNNGFDSSGVHCGTLKINSVSVDELENFNGRNKFSFPYDIQLNEKAFNRHISSLVKTFTGKKQPMNSRFMILLKKILKKMGIFSFVKNIYLLFFSENEKIK